MGRLVSIRHIAVTDGCPVEGSARGSASSAGSAPPPPWTSLAGRAEGDDGRTYSWRIVTTSTLERSVTCPPGADAGLVPVPPLADAPLWLSEGDEAIVVVDAPHFGPELLDVLQYGPAWLRARVFHPHLTDAERAWLEGLEQRDADELVPRAVAALEAKLGEPLRVEADRAVEAAEILLAEGYVISPRHLFRRHRGRFSHRARRTISAWLEEHAPD